MDLQRRNRKQAGERVAAEPANEGHRLELAAVADLPTRHGEFKIRVFVDKKDGKVHGEVFGKENVVTRLHSECLTGDVFGSLRCDCRDQLERALKRIADEPYGVVLYLRQEGRGIGLANKIRAYRLQEQGLDTIDANVALGFREDERDYGGAALMLKELGIRSVRLLTNNPDKIRQLEAHGTRVSTRVPHEIPPSTHNRRYLETKLARSGHLLSLRDVTVA